MSYPPPRPSSTGTNNDSTNHSANAGPSSSQYSQSPHAGQSGQGSGQSPLDWANFMSFPTPPVNNSGPVGNGMRSNSMQGQSGGQGQGQGQYGMQQASHQDSRQDGGHNGNGEESYQAFAQGIAMSRPSPSSINFRQPIPQRQSSSHQIHSTQPSPQQPPTSSHRPSYHQPSPHLNANHAQSSAGPSRSPNGKGKSPANPQQSSSSMHQDMAIDPPSTDNGLSLDPDAFSRDIRFQVPSFLSNQMGGAPTFPPGGEAWSGFGANMFSSDANGGQQLTPGTMFNNAFGLSGDNGSSNGYSNEQSGGGRNVLDGLSGFMGESTWDNWDKTDSTGLTPNPMGTTTFYVNPNPSPSVLGRQNQQQHMQQQTHMQHQQPHQQQPPQAQSGSMQPPMSTAQTSGKSRQNMSDLSVNTNNAPSNSVAQSPRTAHPSAVQSPQTSSIPQKRSSAGSMVSPHSVSSSSTIPTSTIFPQPQPQNQQTNSSNFFVPSMPTSANNQTASTVNIASSSTQPYAPPPNTQALLQGPSLPSIVGPSLTDGPGLYSTTGFDMVGVLGRVAARKDPKTVLGPVDLSCSFLVVDVRRYDSPIVYASPTFTALTGYDLPQILGRNCRFLQSPEGDVVKGSKRKYTDNVAVAHLKRMLNAGKECQASLINYRRGGIPFINLVTVVPIPWDGTDIVYHVGFQVDLVEQPNAILRNMRDGTYQVNYTVANPPAPVLRPAGNASGLGLSQDMLEIMGPRVNMPGFGMGEEGGKMEWLKMVLENADDFVHVLSLKGLFQYVSPSVRRVLEYEPEDLLNKNISDLCHPSDIVPLMRELKDSTHAPADGNTARKVHLVFRIRRKQSGFVWIECTGRLHVEPGKGRKAVILSGRALSVPTLPWDQVAKNGGLSDNEAWMKVSFDGLILHATSTVAEVIGTSVDGVVGESLYSLIPAGDSSNDGTNMYNVLASSLRSASSGETRSAMVLRHRMTHGKRNMPVDVVTVIYPSKPATIRSQSDDSDDSSVESEPSRPSSADVSILSGIKPSSLVVQIKLANPSAATRSIVHTASSNMFEELETTRGTSWQYELHQLRMLNRRLKEDIATAKAKGKTGKIKKRKDGESTTSGSGAGSMGPPAAPPFPEQYNAAPRHQLAPGFGLVAPGMSPYYS